MMRRSDWLKTHKFEAHVAAFLLMILPAIPLVHAALRGAAGWVWFLLGLVVLGNLIAVAVR